MWPLVAFAVLAAALVVWKLADISVAASRNARALDRIDDLLARGMVAEALAAARESDSAAGRIIAAGLARRAAGRDRVARTMGPVAAIETASLEGGLVRLAAIAVIAPLLGFLLATLAILRALRAEESIADAGGAAAAGLVPAAAGLAIGIVVAICYGYCARRVARLTTRIGATGRAAVHAIAPLDPGPA